MAELMRRIRGGVGNALVWGGAWAALGTAAGTVLSGSLLDGLGIGARFGVFGVITGTAFSFLVPLAYHGRRLARIRPLRFGLFGGVVAGAFAPVFMQTMNVLGGEMIPWRYVLDDVPFTALFGALAAGGSLWVAQRAGTLAAPAEPGALRSGIGADAFATPSRDRVA